MTGPRDRDREMARRLVDAFRSAFHYEHTNWRGTAHAAALWTIATARAEGRAEAVAEIVAWLRDQVPTVQYAYYYADRIQREFATPRSAAAEKTSEDDPCE